MAEQKAGSVVVVADTAELKKLLGAPAAGAEGAQSDEPSPSVTEHEVTIGGQRVPYAATCGTLRVGVDDPDKPRGRMFYVAYTRSDVADVTQRPLTFCFNGGPGSSAIWLHMGCFGPRRVRIDVDAVPRPPARAEDHPHSLLDVTDLVFVDPVGTGYSRPEAGKGEDFHGVEGDVESVAEFIRQYVTRHGRWGSPKVVAGESYGTTRASALANHLQQRHGLFLNGLVLLSVALQFQTLAFDDGNDLPYALYLPAYALTAAYHGRVQVADPEAFAAEVERFAIERYTPALMRGTDLPADEAAAIASQIAAYIGVSPEFVQRCNLRIHLGRFCRELLRDSRYTVGRLDSRFKGRDKDAAGESMSSDPSLSGLMGAFGAAFHHELKTRLQYEEHAEVYELLNLKANQAWRWARENRYLDVTDDLRTALIDNEHLQVFVASGLYDLATPAFATDYTLAHLGLEPDRRAAVAHERYPAGHMMYVHEPSMIRLRRDLLAFYERAC